MQAHDALLALTPDEGEAAFRLSTLTLPAGPGVFLAHPLPCDADKVLHGGGPYPGEAGLPRAVVKTWIGSEQTFARQAREQVSWQTLLDMERPTIAKKRG